jgi:cell fate (sporulation/competence/biofilm development) regulator YlbF (YheA/YmcA/DUF963 family)
MWISKEKYNKMLQKIEDLSADVAAKNNLIDFLETKIDFFQKTYKGTIITKDECRYENKLITLGDEVYARNRIKFNFLGGNPMYSKEDIKQIIITRE